MPSSAETEGGAGRRWTVCRRRRSDRDLMPLLVKDSAPGRADARIRRADAWQEKRTMVFGMVALGFGVLDTAKIVVKNEQLQCSWLAVDGKTKFFPHSTVE